MTSLFFPLIFPGLLSMSSCCAGLARPRMAGHREERSEAVRHRAKKVDGRIAKSRRKGAGSGGRRRGEGGVDGERVT